MIKIFSIIFFIAFLIFVSCIVFEIWYYFTENILWIPLYYFLFIIPIPLIGYIMMLIGEYFDNKKLKKEKKWD